MCYEKYCSQLARYLSYFIILQKLAALGFGLCSNACSNMNNSLVSISNKMSNSIDIPLSSVENKAAKWPKNNFEKTE